jgi:hypothetical protein
MSDTEIEIRQQIVCNDKGDRGYIQTPISFGSNLVNAEMFGWSVQ